MLILVSKYQFEIDPVAGPDPNGIYVKKTGYQPPPFIYSTLQMQANKKRSSAKVGKDESNVTHPIPTGPSGSSLKPQVVQYVNNEADTFVLLPATTLHIPRDVVYSHYTRKYLYVF